MLPPIAVLHTRHAPVGQSGAILGTIAGTAALTVGLGGSVNVDLRPAALFVLGVWWWTIGKMWAQTRLFPPPAGILTAALGVAMLAGTLIESADVLSGIVRGYPDTDMWAISQLALGGWLLATGMLLWRSEA